MRRIIPHDAQRGGFSGYNSPKSSARRDRARRAAGGHRDDRRGHMSTRALLHGRTVGLGIVLLTLAFQGSPSAQQGADPSLRVGASDLGGVVTSANGPEAGVWVIAETNDLPTKLAKIVVTDDRGRYLHPRSPEGELSRVGARLWPRRLAEDADGARKAPQPDGSRGAKRRGGGGILPGDLLVLDAEGPGEERVPRHGARWQRHQRGAEGQEQWLDIVKTNGCYTVTPSATRRAARSRRSSVTSSPRSRRGSAGSRPDRPWSR